jgi:hypothetical protein
VRGRDELARHFGVGDARQVTSSSTAIVYVRSAAATRLTRLSIATSPISTRRRRATVPSALSKQAA